MNLRSCFVAAAASSTMLLQSCALYLGPHGVGVGVSVPVAPVVVYPRAPRHYDYHPHYPPPRPSYCRFRPCW